MAAQQIKAKIISNQRFKANYWHLEFESEGIAKAALPGQFVDIRVSDSDGALLRRPLSIHGVKGTKVKLFYEVIGAGTQALAKRKPGELLDIIGPLGNRFKLSVSKCQSIKVSILVAGGMGVAPLVFLAEKLKKSETLNPKSEILVLIGAKTKEQILCAQEFKALGCTVKTATDDGSAGFKGKVTDLFKNLLTAYSLQLTAVYACGPRPMLKAVSEICDENKINTQLSLEEHMACGIGACLGCVVSTKSGYKRVCKDGPVFLSKELIW